MTEVQQAVAARFDLRLERRRRLGQILAVVLFFSTLFGLLVLTSLMVDVVRKGAPWLDWQFLTS